MRLTSLSIGAAFALALLVTTAPVEAQRRRGRDAPVAQGSLVIQTPQEGAEVFVDEQVVGTTPVDPVSVAPGSHTIRVRLPGFTEYTDVVQVAPGQPTVVEVDLLPLSEVLSVITEPPAAHVYVDGNFMGETPVEFDLLEGPHSLRVVLRGYEEAIRDIEARAGSRDELTLTLTELPADALLPHETQWYEEPVTWIAVGGGAVAIAIVIAVVAVATTSSGGSQLDAFCAQPGGCIRLAPAW